MISSLAKIYATAKTSSVEIFKYGWKNDMVGQHGNTLLIGVFSRGQVSWTTSNPPSRNLTSIELKLKVGLFSFFLVCFFHLVPHTIHHLK